MTNTAKPTNSCEHHHATDDDTPDHDQMRKEAQTILSPTVQSALTMQEFSPLYKELNLGTMIEVLSKQSNATLGGDLKNCESMLIAQAHTLDAIFNNLAKHAINSKQLQTTDKFLKLALRAQSQCRSTLEAIATIKNPPIVGYVKQTNIAHGHQQVNNAPFTACEESCSPKNQNSQNKLLEEQDGERLDTRTTSTAGQTDTAMETVGEVDGAKNAER